MTFAPVIHIFGGNPYAVFLCKRQKPQVKFSVLFSRSVVVGVNDTNITTHFCRTFYRTLCIIAYFFNANRKRCVRLVAMDSVVVGNSFKVTKKPYPVNIYLHLIPKILVRSGYYGIRGKHSLACRIRTSGLNRRSDVTDLTGQHNNSLAAHTA